MKIRVLGCSGTIAAGCKTTSFLLDGDCLVDAGTGVGDLTLDDMALVDHVLLTHAHLDHVAALPLMLDAVAARRSRPVQVHALHSTIASLRQHIFNGVIWPDFSRLPSEDNPYLVFQPFALGDVLVVAGKRVEVLPAVHTVPAVGFAVVGEGASSAWVFSGDTGHNPGFWQRVNQIPVGMLVIETAFSDRECRLAQLSQHLCPSTLADQLAMMSPSAQYPIHITHTKPAETALIMSEIDALHTQRQQQGLPPLHIAWLQAGQELSL
ncbi:MAG: 3',5'-cyclic-nucleotide phosphodiesterase [Polaromonas sp.]|nr:3',5'-cyclic-nucleotide phosphodiesterase [Polaromonas sp.]